MSQRIFLKIFKNDSVFKIAQLPESDRQISIGHDSDVEVCLQDEEHVSPWHALIEKRGEDYFISDLGSTQGTLLNNNPVVDSILQHGDQIQIGVYRIEFYIGAPYMAASETSQKPVPPQKPSSPTPPSTSSEKSASASTQKTRKTSAKKATVKKKKTASSTTSSQKKTKLRAKKSKKETPESIQNQKVSPVPPQQNQVQQSAPVPPQQNQVQQSAPVPPQQNQVQQSAPVPPQQNQVQQSAPVPPQQNQVQQSAPVPPQQNQVQQSAPVPPQQNQVQQSAPVPPQQNQVQQTAPVPPQQNQVQQSAPVPPQQNQVQQSAPVPPQQNQVQQTAPPPPQQNQFQQTNLHQMWKKFIPRKKSSAKTFAPPLSIKNLDEVISPGKGNHVEVIVAWGNRILAVHHSTSEENITIGSCRDATIQIPNLMNQPTYSLVQCGQVAQIFLMEHMKGKMITKKNSIDFDFAFQKGIISKKPSGQKVLSLGQNEVVRVDFHPQLKVYIRYSFETPKPQKGLFFDFNESELIGVGVSICLMLLLFFYIGIYYPGSIEDMEEEKETRFATIVLKPPTPPRPPRVTQKKVARKKVARTRQKAPKVTRKKPVVKRSGNKGRLGGVKAKPKSKSNAKTITSARSGGSGAKSRKSGATGKSPQVNPNEVGLLGVFGKKGLKDQLDKAQSGPGVLAGQAGRNSGYSGNKEVYSGEGIGTRFKSAGSGGKGSSLVGISKISTKGRGGGTSGFGRGGNLGTRGRLNLSFGVAEADVEGGIDRDAIDRVLKQNQPQLKACHSSILQVDSSAVGRMSVNVSIVNDKVTQTGIKRNQSGNQRLANCVMERIRNWRFPGAVSAGDKGVVTFHFVFSQ